MTLLGVQHQKVLEVLHEATEELDGLAIYERGEGDIELSSILATLIDLVEDKLVDSHYNRSFRLYSITQAGRKSLQSVAA